MNANDRELLLRVAVAEMRKRGLEPEMPPAAVAEAQRATEPAGPGGMRDLRDLAWCSIDNDDSRDLDQLTVAVPGTDGATRVLVAIADVSDTVLPGSALDGHAGANTTSVYTPARIFPMLPERLSTDLTSLGQDEDRIAYVNDIAVMADGATGSSDVYRALVRNHAKLAYRAVGAWLEGKGPAPPALTAAAGLADNLRLQDAAAQRIAQRRHEQGALELESLEVHARFDGDSVTGLEADVRNRAKDLIENFMIAANGVVAQFLAARRFPVVRRVVRSPERWARIVDIATHAGDRLPGTPDAAALHEFLLRRRAADPVRFPDLSLSIIKLLGRGEYVATFPGDDTTGHFGLAVSDYTHSTAPNRRYPDLVTQRLVGAALAGGAQPYDRPTLEALATHCTQKEDDANKVERQVRKSAAACMLRNRVGETFDGLVTGVSPKGTWARVFDPPVEGRIETNAAGLDVGDRVRVKLVHTDPERGFIDFERIGHEPVGTGRA